MSAFNTPWNMRLEMAKKRGQQGGMGSQPNWHEIAMQALPQQAVRMRANQPQATPQPTMTPVSYSRPTTQTQPSSMPQPSQPSQPPARPVGMGTSPAPTSPSPSFDPMARMELSRRLNQTKRDRVVAAQGGQDIKSFKDAEYEMRLQLAAMNRMRNAERAGAAEVRDPGGVNRAKMLDKQLPGAMLAGNASASDAALRQLALRQRYNLPTDQPMQRLMDLSMEPIAPENPNYFADRAAPRDTTQMQIEARRQLAETMNRPTPGMNALDQRDAFARQMDQLDQRLAMAAQQRAIAEQEAMAKQYGGYIEGGVMSPDGEMQATEQAVGITSANPALAALTANGLATLAQLQADKSPATLATVQNWMDQFDALPPQEQEYVRRAIAAQAIQSGINPAFLGEDVMMTPSEIHTAGGGPSRGLPGWVNRVTGTIGGMGLGLVGQQPEVMNPTATQAQFELQKRLFGR